MKMNIIKKKAASLKELSHEEIELDNISTLKDLLIQITIHEFYKQHLSHDEHVLTKEDINYQAKLGKVTLGSLYNDEKEEITKAIDVMLQDYQDGLFRVFLNQTECIDLNEKLPFLQDNEIVIIKLVMMAGRLW